LRSRPLLLTLKSMIERSYGMVPLIDDVARYVIGDAGLRHLYGERPRRESSGRLGARLLVRDGGEPVRAALYYPDDLVQHLERFNPLTGIGDVNIDAFAVFVEELDHLLTLAFRAAQGRPVSLIELEHHADVTKYLVVLHFLGRQTGRRRLPEAMRLWVRHHLFGKYAPGDSEQMRYREAALLAQRYVGYLEGLSIESRHAELRNFHRRPFAETCSRLASLN